MGNVHGDPSRNVKIVKINGKPINKSTVYLLTYGLSGKVLVN